MTPIVTEQQPYTTMIAVNPSMAESWLANTADFQRSIHAGIVSKYADMMRKGQWKLTHQSIALDKTLRVIDGQHRCKAIVESGQTIEMMVTFNADPDTFSALDRGYRRTLVQISNMAGKGWATGSAVSAVNALRWDQNKVSSAHKSWAPDDLLQVLEEYKEEIGLTFPPHSSGSTQLRSGPIRGAILRAFISKPEHKDRISEFVRVLANGTVINGVEDNAALTLRTKLLSTRLGANDQRIFAWCITLTALRLFIPGTNVKYSHNLRPSKVQPFPIELDLMLETESFAAFKARRERERLEAASKKSKR